MFTERLSRHLRAPFPIGAPDWPSAVERPAPRPTLGIDYDTAWARRYPVRLARVAYTELVTRPLVAAVARPHVEGLDRFENVEGPVIFAANHASHLDLPVLTCALPDRWRHNLVAVAAADYFFDTRLKAAYFSFALNAVPMDRSRVNRRSAYQAQQLVEEGWNLMIFPEGGRSHDGWAREHTGGAAWLATRTGRPLVPVHIQGTGRLWPRGARRIYTGRTRVTFGRPLSPGEVPAREMVGLLESAVAQLADEAATDWWSARQRAAKGSTPDITGPRAAAWRRAWALGPSPKDGARRRSPAEERHWPPRP